MKMMHQIALLIHYTIRTKTHNEIDTLIWLMKDGESSLQCASIVFCYEEMPTVNFML